MGVSKRYSPSSIRSGLCSATASFYLDPAARASAQTFETLRLKDRQPKLHPPPHQSAAWRLEPMNRRGLLSGFLVLVCLATLWGVWGQRNQLAALRAEQQQLLAQLAAERTAGIHRHA